MKIIEAIASFRAGGYEEALGFTVYDTLRYRKALEPLVARGGAGAARAARRRRSRSSARWRSSPPGVEPLRELIGAMHSKLLLAELRRHRAGSDARTRCPRARYQRARWCSITPRPRAARSRPGACPVKVPNGAR